MTLLTLGDSHALFCYAGVADARIFWRGPITMHRVARDGIRSIVPGNCNPQENDVLVLSFGEIDCRVHIPKIASAKQTTTKFETLALCDRFERSFTAFTAKSRSRVALSCIIPPAPVGFATEFYRSEEECIEDAIVIRDMMNHRLSQMAPLIDFRKNFVADDGKLSADRWDGSVHIDSRVSQPVVDAINKVMNTDYTATVPVWPHPFPMAQPPYISPIRAARRKIKRFVLSSLRLRTYPPKKQD